MNVPTLEKRLETLRPYSVDEIFELSQKILPSSKLPTDFLNGLTENDKATCLLASIICWSVTGGTQVPRAMQLRLEQMNPEWSPDTFFSSLSKRLSSLPVKN